MIQLNFMPRMFRGNNSGLKYLITCNNLLSVACCVRFNHWTELCLKQM